MKETEEDKISPEELEKRKKDHMSMLDSSIEVLKKEAEYEKLLMEIDEYRTKRLMYNIQYAKTYQEHKNKKVEPNKVEKENNSNMRVLKKDKDGEV